MADTLQIVTWALEKTCLLRDEKQAKSTSEAFEAVGRARMYSENLRNKTREFGIFDDVYVTSYTFYNCPKSKKGRPSVPYPTSGFLISKEFKSLDGPTGLFAMCSSCQANTTRSEIAGCCGKLHQRPDSQETEEQIRGIIFRLGLERQFEEMFPKTTPIWYGLWAVSPVPTQSLELLRTIISTMRDEYALEMEINHKVDKKLLWEFTHFVKATEVAQQQNIPLHVNLLPLGHTDFGWHTIFPHCPFCKAAARIERWQRKYPTALYDCHVCGRRYSPAETAQGKRMNKEQDDLREVLGTARFLEFVKEYLIVHGETAESAGEIIREKEAQEIAKQENLLKLQAVQKKKREFLEVRIFNGLETASPPPSHYEEDELSSQKERWFTSKVFYEVLRRCEIHGVLIRRMIHDSFDGKTDRQESPRNFGQTEAMQTSQKLPLHIANPREIFNKWLSEGCDGKFNAAYQVPDEVVQ